MQNYQNFKTPDRIHKLQKKIFKTTAKIFLIITLIAFFSTLFNYSRNENNFNNNEKMQVFALNSHFFQEKGQNIDFFSNISAHLHFATLNISNQISPQLAEFDSANNKNYKAREQSKPLQLLKFNLYFFIFLCFLPVIIVILLLLAPKISRELIAENLSQSKTPNKQNLCFDKKSPRKNKHDNFDNENL